MIVGPVWKNTLNEQSKTKDRARDVKADNRSFHTGRAASDFFTLASKFSRACVKFNVTPNGQFLASHQNFDAALSV